MGSRKERAKHYGILRTKCSEMEQLFLILKWAGGSKENFLSRIHYVMFFVLLIGRVEYIQKKRKNEKKREIRALVDTKPRTEWDIIGNGRRDGSYW